MLALAFLGGFIVLAAAIVAHGRLVAERPIILTIAAPATPPSPSYGQENDPMPGPETQAIIDSIAARIQAAISSGVSSSLASVSTSIAEAASTLVAADDAATAGDINTALTDGGAPAVTSSLTETAAEEAAETPAEETAEGDTPPA